MVKVYGALERHSGVHGPQLDCLLVAVPSLWQEPFGMVGIEAMASGKPVVAFNVGGVSKWLAEGVNGYAVARGDIAGFARKMMKICVDEKLRVFLGKGGRRIYEERFTSEIHMRRLCVIFSLLAAKGDR